MRSKPVVTRHRADEDVDQAIEYYLTVAGADVAVSFIENYESATSHLSRFPLSGSPRLEHALTIHDLRQWTLRDFPYAIIYFDRENSVEIWRVLHLERDIPAIMQDE